jgi:hypothetical protein
MMRTAPAGDYGSANSVAQVALIGKVVPHAVEWASDRAATRRVDPTTMSTCRITRDAVAPQDLHAPSIEDTGT